ncbi:MAG: DnaA ATPase domain-containing protein, partial [Actinomycetota bacterium]
MTNAEQLWRSCAEALQDHVSDATWKTWFEGITPVSAADGYLRLAVPSALVKERLEGRYLPLLEHAASVAAGEAVAIAVDVQTESRGQLVAVADSQDDDGRPISDGQGSALPTLTPPAEAYSIRPDPPLNIRYTFDTFVIGTSNRFAHAAALSVAETPAKSYNPLFVHGGAGLGKTHLLQAIGNYVRQHFPARPVRYVTTETFTNEFIDAIRANTKPAFKRRYRDCGVLLVDDIQFLENKEGTQEEFFHT